MGTGKTLIICKSVHHQNTAIVAQAIADVLHAEIYAPEDVPYARLDEYDLIGLGSGIYFGQFHSSLRRWVREMPCVTSQRQHVFLFSTSGLSFLWRAWHWPLKSRLQKKGWNVIGEFHCRGFDSVGPLWLMGGINRHHPDDRDLEHAASFARDLVLRSNPC